MKRLSVILLVTLVVSALAGAATFFLLIAPTKQEIRRLQGEIMRIDKERKVSQAELAENQSKRLELQKELSLYSVFDLRKSSNKETQAAITTNMSILSYIEILKRHHITIEEVLPLTNERPKIEGPASGPGTPALTGIRPQGQGFSSGPGAGGFGGFGKVNNPASAPAAANEVPEFDARKYRLNTRGLYVDYVAAFEELRRLPPTIQLDRCEVVSDGLNASQAVLRVSYGLSVRMLQGLNSGMAAPANTGGGFGARSGGFGSAPPPSVGGFQPKKTSCLPAGLHVARALAIGRDWLLGFPAEAKPARSPAPRVDRSVFIGPGEIRLRISGSFEYRQFPSKDEQLHILDLPDVLIQRSRNFERPIRGIRWLHLGQFKEAPGRIGRLAFMMEEGVKPNVVVSPDGCELIVRVGGPKSQKAAVSNAQPPSPTPAPPPTQAPTSRYLFPVIGQFDLGRTEPFRKLVVPTPRPVEMAVIPSKGALPSPPPLPPSPQPVVRRTPKPPAPAIVLRGVFMVDDRATSAFVEVGGEVSRVKAGDQLPGGLAVVDIQPTYLLLQGKDHGPVTRIDWKRELARGKASP